MDLELIKHCYEGAVIIDKKNGNIVYSDSKKPFEDFKINSIKKLDEWFINNTYTKTTPIFTQITRNNKTYWITRQLTSKYICYFIQYFPHLDAIIEDIKQKSIKDGLTNAYNKKETEEQLKRYLLLYLRNPKNIFTIIMFDIDFFKKVNDIYGHLAGDYVLKELSKLTQNIIRDSDIFGRFGGEEFIIILPETKVVGAIKLAERLRKACGEHTFIFNGQKLKIHISVGITSVTKTDSVKSLIERCDAALYDAKKNGRNRIEYR